MTNSDADSESTVYLNTKSGVATSEDYSSISNEKVVFKAFQNSHKVTINTKKDTSDEGKEDFNLNLYKDLASSNAGGTAVATAKGYIEDEWSPSYTYSISSDAGTANEAKIEGQKITFTVERSNSGTISKAYVSTVNKSAITGDDFEDFRTKKSYSKRTKKR